MATEYINVYMNEPTEGAQDGTCVSNGTFTSPIKFNFSADHSGNVMDTFKLAIRTETGFKTKGETIIKVENDTEDEVFIAWSKDEVFTKEISTTEEITDKNKIFYIFGRIHYEVEVIDSEHSKVILREPGKYTDIKLNVYYLVQKASP